MLLLLPPSEGKAPGGEGVWRPTSGAFGRSLGAARREVARALAVTADSALKVRGETAEHARRVNRILLEGSPARPATDRYTGVVAQGLGYHQLPATQQARARAQIVILSGLLGAVNFADPTPDYRAPMDATLPGVGPLTTFWAQWMAQRLEQRAEGAPIVDLLTTVHRRAVPARSSAWHVIDLVHPTVVGGHAAKFVKGELAAWLLTHDLRRLGTWRSGEWRARRREE